MPKKQALKKMKSTENNQPTFLKKSAARESLFFCQLRTRVTWYPKSPKTVKNTSAQ